MKVLTLLRPLLHRQFTASVYSVFEPCVCVCTFFLNLKRCRFCRSRFINGLVEFDCELLSLRSTMRPSVRGVRALNKTFWTALMAGLFGYYLVFQIKMAAYFTAEWFEETHAVNFVFHPPSLIVSAVFATACFYLYNLGNRFLELNVLCERLPPGLTDSAGGWSDSEMTVLAECIRLLHAKLSGLLGLFSSAYGLVLLTYFTTTFAMTFLDLFFMIVYNDARLGLGIIPYVYYAQYAVFTVTILGVATWVIEKVTSKIISNVISLSSSGPR